MGLTQEEFAKKSGVGRRTQVRYESDERCPDGLYFINIAKMGADVNYILTGIRAQQPPQAPPLPEPTPEDPLARRKAQIKIMVDRTDDARKLDAVQDSLDENERVKVLEQRVAELEKKSG